MNDRKFDDILEAVNFIVSNMVTKAEFNERMDTVDNRLAALEHRATGLESKVNGIHRRLDEEAMERTDITALLERMSKVEKHVGFDAK